MLERLNSVYDESTANPKQKLYPDDLATGYDIQSFRGLWKISFRGLID